MNIVQLSMKCGRWIVQCICNEIHWTPPPVLTLLKIGTEVWMNSSRELMMMKKGWWCYNGISCVTFWCYDTNLSVLQHSLSLPRDGTNKYIFASCDSALLSNTWLSLCYDHPHLRMDFLVSLETSRKNNNWSKSDNVTPDSPDKDKTLFSKRAHF